MLSTPRRRPLIKWAAGLVMACAAIAGASHTLAQTQHITNNACSVTLQYPSGTFWEGGDGCAFPMISYPDVHGGLTAHWASTHTNVHAYFESNDRQHDESWSGWQDAYDRGFIHSWCPGARIRRTCSASKTNWSGATVYSSAWYTFTYPPDGEHSPNNNTPDQHCPSNKPYMLRATGDTSAWH